MYNECVVDLVYKKSISLSTRSGLLHCALSSICVCTSKTWNKRDTMNSLTFCSTAEAMPEKKPEKALIADSSSSRSGSGSTLCPTGLELESVGLGAWGSTSCSTISERRCNRCIPRVKGLYLFYILRHITNTFMHNLALASLHVQRMSSYCSGHPFVVMGYNS